MKKQSIFRALAFLGFVPYVLALFMNLWTIETTLTDDILEFGLFAKFPESVAQLFSLGDKTFSTLGTTLVAVFAIVGLVSLCAFLVFCILSWCKAMKQKTNRTLLLVSAIALLVSALGILVGGVVFTTQTASIQIPFTSTYYDVYSGSSMFYILLLIGSVWSALFGLLSVKKAKNKSK